MTIETARALMIAAAIVSSLVTAIVFLVRWIQTLINKRDADKDQQIADLQERLDKAQADLAQEHMARLRDAQEYANGVISLSHRFREALHALIRWKKRT